MGPRPALSGRGKSLEPFRLDLILTREELWVSYVGLGGVAGIDDVARYMSGQVDLNRQEHNTIAQALNERFMELGLNHPVPYFD